MIGAGSPEAVQRPGGAESGGVGRGEFASSRRYSYRTFGPTASRSLHYHLYSSASTHTSSTNRQLHTVPARSTVLAMSDARRQTSDVRRQTIPDSFLPVQSCSVLRSLLVDVNFSRLHEISHALNISCNPRVHQQQWSHEIIANTSILPGCG